MRSPVISLWISAFFAFSAAAAALIPGPARAQMPGPAKPVFERGDSVEPVRPNPLHVERSVETRTKIGPEHARVAVDHHLARGNGGKHFSVRHALLFPVRSDDRFDPRRRG